MPAMPYPTVESVPSYVPAAKRAQWREVWNSAHSKAKSDGKSDKEAESSAFAQANGVTNKRIKAVIGNKPGNESFSVQSLSFIPKAAWNPDEIKDWLKGHKKATGLTSQQDCYCAPQAEMSEFDPKSLSQLTVKGRNDGGYDLDESLSLDDTATFDSACAKMAADGYGEPVIEGSDHPDFATVAGQRVHKKDFAYAPEGSGPSEWKLPVHDAGHAKNALARYNQADIPADAKEGVKRKIVRAAKNHGVDTSGFEKKYMTEGRKILLSEFRDSDGAIRIMVAYTNPKGLPFEKDGDTFEITPSDLKMMMLSLKREGPIPTDYGHWSADPEAGPGQDIKSGSLLPDNPEIIKAADADPEGKFAPEQMALMAWWKPTPRAMAHVKAEEYESFSPEFDWQGKDEHGRLTGTTLKAGALTNRPFLRHLPKIKLTDEGYNSAMGFPKLASGSLVALTLTEKGRGKVKLTSEAKIVKKLKLKKVSNPPGVEPITCRFKLSDGSGNPATPGSEDGGEFEVDGGGASLAAEMDDGSLMDEVLRRLSQEGDGGAALRRMAQYRNLHDVMVKHASGGNDGEVHVTPGADDQAMPKSFAEPMGCVGLTWGVFKGHVKTGIEMSVKARESSANLLMLGAIADKTKGVFLDAQTADKALLSLLRTKKIDGVDSMRLTIAKRDVEDAIRAFKILPKEALYFTDQALSEPDKFAEFVKNTTPRVQALSIGANPSANPGDAGLGEETASQEIDRLARKIIADDAGTGKKTAYMTAVNRVQVANPALKQRRLTEQNRPRSVQAIQ